MLPGLIESPDLIVLPAPREPVQVIALPRPFTLDRRTLSVPQGLRLYEILLEAGIPPSPHVRVWIDDWLIPPEMWWSVRPRAGRLVTVRVVPMGGEGGGQKNTGRLIAFIGIALIAVVTSVLTYGLLAPVWGAVYAGLAASLVATAVTVAGGLLVNALIPIQQPQLDALSGPESLTGSQTYSLQGARNRMAVYSKVPKVLGWHRMTPPYAAEPVSSIEGDNQYLTVVFCCGYGPVEFYRPRIGDQPLSNFTDVVTEQRAGWPDDPPLTLYQNDVHEEPIGLLLEQHVRHLIRTTQAEITQISVDILFPRGLGAFHPDSGELFGHGVTVRIHARPQGTGTWMELGTEFFTGPTREAFRRSYAFTVAVGTYEVSVGRDTPPTGAQNTIEDVYWATLRSARFTPPITMTGLALYAMKIKATEQLQGVVDTFNVEVVSVLPDWTGSAWVTRGTTNPASIWRHVLQGPATRSPVSDARLNLTAIQEWADWCTFKRYRYGAVIDYETTVKRLLDDIAAVGLASTTLDSNGRYSIVRDIAQGTPIQLLTPRNSRGFMGRKALPDQPHAFRVRYIDGNPGEPMEFGPDDPAADASWELEETLVYAPGHSVATATRFEDLEFRGVTAHHHAVGLAKYHMRVLALRPETWEIELDVENLIVTRGDRVHVTHDVMLAGLGWGRVKQYALDGGGQAVGFIADEELFTETGKSYQVILREPTGAQVTIPIFPSGIVTDLVTYQTPRPPGVTGELFAWGETGVETIAALVRAIEPGPDLTARLTLVPYNEAIYAYDTDEPFPPYDPHITRAGARPPWKGPGQPAAPFIDAVQADETVVRFGPAGEPHLRILVSVRYVPKQGAPEHAPEFVSIETQYRLTPYQVAPEAAIWRSIGAVPSTVRTIEIAEADIVRGRAYDIRIRTMTGTRDGASEWRQWDNILVTGRTTNPPDVHVLVVSGRQLRWAYPTPPPVDLWGFQLRRHFGTRTVWEDAHAMHYGLLASTETTFWIDYYDNDATYLIKAVNTSGLESVNAATVLVNLPSGIVFGDRLDVNILDAVDYQAMGYPGTVSNGALIAPGVLGATPTSLFWTGTDSGLLWQGDAELFWAPENYLEMEYIFSILPDADQVPASITLQAEVVALSHVVEYRPAGTELFWGSGAAAFWSGGDAASFWTATAAGWLPWPGTIQALTRQVHEFRIRTAPGPVQGIIDFCTIVVDVPDIRQHFANQALAATTGTRLPIPAGRYREIKIVSAVILDDGGSAVRIEIADKGTGGPPLTGGPLLKALDSVGAVVAGHADVEIIGY